MRDAQAGSGKSTEDSSYRLPKYRTRRKAPHVTAANEITVSELQAHYDRLCRCDGGFPWKRGFLGLAVLLAGAVIGAVLAGPGWTDSVKFATVLALFCLVAWRAVDEKETEALTAIRTDFKREILDSIEFVPVEEGEGGSPQPAASVAS